MTLYFAQHLDSIALLPCVSVTLGRCECCNEVGAILLHLDVLAWTVGIEFHFWTHQ